MNFKALLQSPEYEFIRTEPRLGDRIMLLGVSGSYGYGTNREGSDVDLRGVTLNMPSDLIGLTSFEQFEDRKTDTVVYSFNKMVSLLLNCNPNTIEILGLDDDQYLIRSAPGQELLDHRGLFLSKRAAASFGHYAEHALDDFNRRNDEPYKTNARLYIDKAQTEGLETEIFLDADFRRYPLRHYNDLMNTLNAVVRDYDKIGKRNHKKDDNHLNKHAMHLVRLFMMGIDILEKREIRTHRCGEDLALLRSIRDGAYMRDSVLTAEFYEIVADYERKFREAEKYSPLPDNPDMEKIEEFVERINRCVVEGKTA